MDTVHPRCAGVLVGACSSGVGMWYGICTSSSTVAGDFAGGSVGSGIVLLPGPGFAVVREELIEKMEAEEA
jgi:hypothetical protein